MTIEDDNIGLEEMGHGSVAFPVAFIEALSDAEHVETILRIVAEWLPEMLRLDRASIALLEGGDLLRIYALAGNDAIPLNKRFPLQDSHLGDAVRQGETMVYPDLRQQTDAIAAKLVESGLRSSVICPLISGGICYGTLNGASVDLDGFDARTIEIMNVLSRWIAVQIRVHRQIATITELAECDPLTSIYNRRAFLKIADEQVTLMRAAGSQLTVALMDLDMFKSINDHHGHHVGDEILKAVVTAAAGAVRREDILARLGGEEFVLLMKGTDIREAEKIAERIRAAIEEISLDVRGYEVSCTVSIGLARLSAMDRSISDVLVRADRALYEAKDAGRNRVVCRAA